MTQVHRQINQFSDNYTHYYNCITDRKTKKVSEWLKPNYQNSFGRTSEFNVSKYSHD